MLLLVMASLAACRTEGATPASGKQTAEPPACPPEQLYDADGICKSIEAAVTAVGGTAFWVDARHPAAADTNPGTRDHPWKSISRAANELAAGDGVIIRAGIYREAIRPTRGGTSPEARITYAAYPSDVVVVTGADPAPDGWRQTGGQWRRAWTGDALPAYASDESGPPEPFRRELVVSNGRVLRPVFRPDAAGPGTVYVEGPDAAPLSITVPSPDNIEIGRRDRLFAPVGNDAFGACGTDDQPGFFRVVGLSFRHAANRAQVGAFCAGSRGSLVEDVRVEWTNGLGMDTSGENHVFRRVEASDNGQAGFGGSATQLLLEDAAAHRNNWRGHYIWWEAGGGKWVRTERSIFRRVHMFDNEGVGFWLDMDNRRNVIEDGVFVRNLGAGIMLEWSTTETLVQHNTVVGTRWNDWSGSGILSQAASHNAIIHNTVVGSEGHGVWLRYDPERRAADGDNLVFNNILWSNAQAPATGEARELSVEDASLERVRSNQFSGNIYMHHGSPRSGWDVATFFVYPVPGGAPPDYRGSDLHVFQRHIGSGQRDRVMSRSSTLFVDPSRVDGLILLPEASVRGAAAPLPARFGERFGLPGAPPRAASDPGA